MMTGNILIVDDCVTVLKLLEALLKSEGYYVRPFTNGECALRSLLADPAELILLDVRMPVMDGFEVYRRIRENVRLTDTPVIFISSASDTEDKIKAFKAGCVDYITKPFQREEVVARVKTHLALYRSKLELIQAEKTQRENQETLRTIADYTYDWEYWEGQQQQLLYMSPSCERITGYALSDFMADPELLYSIIYPEDQPLMREHHENISAQEEGCLDIRIVRKDSDVRWIAHGCRAVYGSDGRFLGRRASNRDITDRKLIEQSLREAEERSRLSFESAAIGMALVSIEGRFMEVNPALCNIVGYPYAELTKKTFQEITHPDDLDADLGYAQQLITGERTSYQMEKRYFHKDGHVIWILLTGSCVRDTQGEFLYFIAQIQDITDRKVAEEQVWQLAYFDTLTRLPNRRMLLDRLNIGLTQAKRFHRSLAVMFLDLDNFKTINDTLGHDVGDELLKEVAMRITTCVRSGDTVARQGGDEFIIVLPEISGANDASLVAEKIIAVLDAPILVGERALTATASIGIAVYPINGSDDVLELMKKADKAMYASKAIGRNCFTFFAD